MKGLVFICFFGILTKGLIAQQEQEQDQDDMDFGLTGNMTLRRILNMVPPIQAQIIPFEAQSPVQVQFVRKQDMRDMREMEEKDDQEVQPEQEEQVEQERQVVQPVRQQGLSAAVISRPSPVLSFVPARRVRPAVQSLFL